MTNQNFRPHVRLIIVAALGYFVDIYDLIVFNVVKKESLESLGFVGDAFKTQEIALFNYQMIGMLLGGILFGVFGDKKGRISVLFGSIFLYSAANIANAYVDNINSYALCRFIAGIGLAGELGAGITLIAETMHKDKRGYGTMIIVTFGALGAVVASLVGNYFGWKMTYLIGGGMGLLLLLLRAGTFESNMFKQLKSSNHPKGNFFMLFKSWNIFSKYLASILIGLPVWFVIGILFALSNQFAEANGVQGGTVLVSKSVMYGYIGLSLGDLMSGLLSQWLKSRKKVVVFYLFFSLIISGIYLFGKGLSISVFYFLIFCLGLATGYWALFVTMASEQFGTNIRSTVTTTVPNFVRGSVVPMTLSFKFLIPTVGIIASASIVGLVSIGIALLCTWYVEESFSKDLDYLEIS
ncbi:MAG: MFS transporter [Saprospiraceae bacterium]|jgi:putative MFS transporter|nr:MFS transporter [Saprospiraceae bacterium]